MWQLYSDKDGRRVYKNSTTNSECVTIKCYEDKDGNNWYEFQDLTALPFTRDFAANKIYSLFAHGMTPEDVEMFFIKHKATLRGADDGEKYEQAYAELLEFENKFKSAVDPVKKLSSLVCVYFTLNDEPIDSFANSIQLLKLSLLEADPQMHNFFLRRQSDLIEISKTISRQRSPIASTNRAKKMA